MKVFIDPKTGEIRDPTDAERAALERQDSKPQSSRERRQTESKLKNGRGTAITLEGEPQTAIQACTQADGSVVVDHNCDQTKPPQQDDK